MSTTLLDMVQDILSDMDADEVNSISDTIEAEQVARIVIATFNNMAATSTWANSKNLVTLTASGDNTIPTHMTLPADVKELISINYDKRLTSTGRKQYDEVLYKYPDDFLRYINGRDSSATNTLTVTDPSGIELLILNDAQPTYFTSFDDTTIVFDSYYSSVDNTLQSSKVQALAYIFPTLAMKDSSIIDLPVDVIPGLREEATSRAQLKLRQFQDVKAEQAASHQRRYVSRKSWRAHRQQRYPNYGRRTAEYKKDPTFRNEG